MKVWTLALLLLLGCMGLTGCGDDTDNGNGEDLDSQGGELNKEQARRRGGVDRQGRDMCERGGWYGDGECDDFCPNPDPDCAPDNNGTDNNGTNNNGGEPQACGSRGLPACGEGLFCLFSADSECGATDRGGVCSTRPEACTEEYAPVCGCDGQTYSNECSAHAAGMSVAYVGECDGGNNNNNPGEVACGGRLGDTCADAEFCFYDQGEGCGFADGAGVCRPRPELCTEEYAPVCGCDNQTYSNECAAHAAGVSVYQIGECGAPQERACGGLLGLSCERGEFCDYPLDAFCGAADQTGVCRPTPEACTQEYAPVCGCDGNTYGNACEANSAGTSVSSLGECEPIDDGEGRTCGSRIVSCNEGLFCLFPVEAACDQTQPIGVCTRPPDVCPRFYDPVCGCDGQTYGNECEAHRAGTSVAASGECGGPEPVSCGGRLGDTCGRGEFCLYELGDICGWADATGTCAPRPEACTREYAPVCGCDGNTYSNDCTAHVAGVSVQHVGACDEPQETLCGSRGLPACEDGKFCNFAPEDQCGATDRPGVCEARPEFCTEEYAPVCGCDGQTYSNGCFAQMAGVSVASRGECGGGEEVACGGRLGDTCGRGEFCLYAPSDICGRADATGVCAPRPELCTQEYAPVCGCDGNTYSNECAAHGAGVSVLSSGECGAPQEVLCGSRGLAECPDGQFCAYRAEAQCGANDLPGVCAVRPEACIQIYDPVCGCDGNTYGNACDAASAGVSVQHDGECERPDPGFCGGFAGFTCDRGEFCNYPIEAQCGAGDQTGTCEPIPMICTQEYAPVCGCDGQTYSNACHAFGAGVSVAARGECER